VLGPNGAGKSTTLRMLTDIIAPDRGTIELLGGLRPGTAATGRVGYLPEERGLYAKMAVLEMIRFMGELRGMSAGDARRRAGEWLARLGLSQWAKNKVGDLSKGMQQKVQFACALIHDPDLVILDEPWSGLDPINADVLRTTVLELKARGRTVLFSTHLMEHAEQICDEVCIIAGGEKVLDGQLTAIKDAEGQGRLVALRFVDLSARKVAEEGPLANREWVIAMRPPRSSQAGDPTELIAELTADTSAQALLAALVTAGVQLRRFELVVPTLHQIFIDRVGEAARIAERREVGA